ncbi:hypothetical protein IPZ58_28170 [Streptomyces roseoverticillatus]|uniref:hypothetical protein n=1 Tax=Streptomyces roseoverticillatus TaxID=66429 RepID=UPI001F4576D5|nr:hypothetical protein [Streptomyces roseoverticillatus]MCF3105437.1 hypothetical protein [Streptomyces roseoverticillatus]
MAQEIRIQISDEAYEQLQRAAAEKHVLAEEYAGQVLDADLIKVRFLEGAQSFINEHAEGFAERFGRPATRRVDAA